MSDAHHLVLVPHTHWDREWYRTHEQFRTRLVELIDRVLELLESDPGFRHFTLDGQSVVLDDYLEVRPRAAERIAKLVSAGRLFVGPWYVLPDEWLVSAEALVRNLRLGMARADAAGGSMRLGYVPDQFGHVGQLPQIFAGMGFDAAALWRGVGANVGETLFDWEAPDGTRLLTVHLARSYSNAANLPSDPAALAGRLRGEIEGLGRRSRIPTLLLMAGTDHALPDPRLPRSVEAALADLPGVTAEIGHLPGFVARARAEAPPDRPLHRGELRSGLRSPLLPGCASARTPQKQQDFVNDRWLTRYWEPLAAWWGALGGRVDREWLDLAWRIALENHPHDSICGCSVDAVHEQMETRFARVREIAEAQVDRIWADLAAHIRPPAGPGDGSPAPAFGVWNPGTSGPTPVAVELEVEEGGDGLAAGAAVDWCVHDAGGRPLPTSATRLEPAEDLLALELPRSLSGFVTENDFHEFLGFHVQDVSLRREGDTLWAVMQLGRSPIPIDDLESRRAALREAVAASDAEQIGFRARTRSLLRLEFVDDLPGCGLRVYDARPGRSAHAGQLAAAGSPDEALSIANAHWSIEVDRAGRVRLARRGLGADSGREWVMEDALRLVSEGDRGDEYNFDPVPGAAVVATPARVELESAEARGALAELAFGGHLQVPRGLDDDRSTRSADCVDVPFRARIRLWADLDRIDLSLQAGNTARDHRMRIHLRAPFAAEELQVESAFELARRPVEPAGPAPGERIAAERPVGATPQRQWAGMSGGGFTLSAATRGLAEVEALREEADVGALAITWWRSVGWLSRGDLAYRPGHAGPPFATPGAQVQGGHTAELSWRWHPAGESSRLAEAHRFAYPPLARPLPPGSTSAPVLEDGARLVSLEAEGIVHSAIEPVEDGGFALRVWNPEPSPAELELAVGLPGGATLVRTDLRGVPLDGHGPPAAVGEGRAAALTLGPCQIATWVVRPAPREDPRT
ncbi:MAG: hypothetical protein ACQGVK_10685 [Myxococcota bacterium]